MTKVIFSAALCLSMYAFCALAEAQQTSQAEQDAVDFMGALATVCKSARPAIAGWASEVRQSEAAQQQQAVALAQYWADYVKGISAQHQQTGAVNAK